MIIYKDKCTDITLDIVQDKYAQKVIQQKNWEIEKLSSQLQRKEEECKSKVTILFYTQTISLLMVIVLVVLGVI